MFPHLLSNLPNLQAIVFGTGTDDYAKYDESLQRQLVKYLGTHCPSLTQVVISLTNWRNDWIWTRDAEDLEDGMGVDEWLGMVSHEPVNLEEMSKMCDLVEEGDEDESMEG